jgi:hypothetical protein
MQQRELKGHGPLLNPDGTLADLGWARQPVLDCNLEDCRVYDWLRFWQPMRVKRWDYYAVTTPDHFFSFTVSDIGYLGSIFAYAIDFASGDYHEETLTIPLARGVTLPRNSTAGQSCFDNGQVRLDFQAHADRRTISVRWPGFYNGDFNAELTLEQPPEHESLVIVIPIRGRRFYYNRKINCLRTHGQVSYGGKSYEMDPQTCLGSLDWGRGVWEYRSFWVWASASGFLSDGRRVGLNLGYGFGDTSQASENCIILDGIIHKLGEVKFTYSNQNFKAPWTMKSDDGRLDLEFTPFFERNARTDLKLLGSEVHQMFGRYRGTAVSTAGERLEIHDLIGWAEEHHAKW